MCSIASHVYDPLRLSELQPTGLLYPWDSPGKDPGVGCHFLLQGIFPIQASNLSLLHCRQSMMDRSWKRSERDSGHKRMKGRKRRAAQHSLGPDDLHQRCTGKTENHREQAKANPYSFKFLMNIVSWLNLLLKSTK